LLASPAMLDPVIAKSFALFDHNNNGFIECHEVVACADAMLKMVGINK
jgi:Ca2+-binding EF-hand superfamily protein